MKLTLGVCGNGSIKHQEHYRIHRLEERPGKEKGPLVGGPFGLHVAAVFAAYVVEGVADLAEAVVLHGVH